jgi:tetratricopeptide (TPR) repeat protein
MLLRFGALLGVGIWLSTAASPQDNFDASRRFSGLPGSIASPIQQTGHTSSVSGVIESLQGQPTSAVHIRIQDLASGQMVGSAYADRTGAFVISNVPDGAYDLIATEGLNEWRQRIVIEGMDVTVSVRMPQRDAFLAGHENSISVVQMKVPEKARRAYQRARAAARDHKINEEQKYIAEALAVDPDYADALTLRGLLEFTANQLDQAEADLEKAARCDSNYAPAYLGLGIVYNATSRFDDALRVLEHSLSLDPTAWPGYLESGKAYLEKGDNEAALRQLDKAQDLAPKYALVHFAKAQAFWGMKDYKNAVTELEFYLQRDPQGPASVRAREVLERLRAVMAANSR